MLKLGEDVLLLHELRELVSREELLETSLEGSWGDEGQRLSRVRLNRRHSVLDVSLHLRETHAELLLHELANVSNSS